MPDELKNLKDLKVLDLAENNLLYLPYGLKEVELQAIWLSENQSKSLIQFRVLYYVSRNWHFLVMGIFGVSTLEKFTEDRIPVDGEMKQVLLCYMLPQQKKTQEFVLRRSVIESVDIKLMQKEEHHRGSRLSGTFPLSSQQYFRVIKFFRVIAIFEESKN